MEIRRYPKIINGNAPNLKIRNNIIPTKSIRNRAMFMPVSLKFLNFRETILIGLTSRMAKKMAKKSTTP